MDHSGSSLHSPLQSLHESGAKGDGQLLCVIILHCTVIFNFSFLLKLRNTLNWQQQCLDLTLEGRKSGGRLHPTQLHSPSYGILNSVDRAEECPEAETTQ